ncbi:MAG: flagellar type III secretion system pore protein FliP [bacterium]
MRIKKFFISILTIFFIIFIGVLAAKAQVGLPSVNISIGQTNTPEEFSKGLQILVLLTILTLAPSILVMTTSFTRIVIVLSLVRQALGTASLPPSQVIVGLALILTFFVMSPTINEINTQAFQPYMNKEITQQVALKKGIEPLRQFMFRQTDETDLALFVRMAKISNPTTTSDIPTYVLLPSFVISELKTAFKIGFMIFIPFLVIDVVVSSILVSMGMLFLPPVMISLPFKIILFVLIDGWYLIAKSLVMGFV